MARPSRDGTFDTAADGQRMPDAEPDYKDPLPPIVFKTCATPQFSNDFFEIARSPTAGWGAFAVKTLRQGDVILRERPLFIADSPKLFSEYDKLEPQAKEVALSLHAHGLVKPGTPRIQAVWATNWQVAHV